MNIIEIINKKKNNEILTKEEIEFAVMGFSNGDVKDYQMSALLMAICINGMSDEETYALTEVMVNSGSKLDLRKVDGVKIDKHSTGGIGDKVTLILAPLVASTGIVVPKMSGRGLGHTGGTIDKLESIEGFRVSLSEDEIFEALNKVKMVVASQTGDIALADKKIYALRDVTGTVDSIPLIASSIMSKKIACGANKLVIDVKVGNGALMQNLDDAKLLANTMIKIGKAHNIETVCVITDMNQPLGLNVGNGLEVIEAIDVLKDRGNEELKQLVIKLASLMVSMAKEISLEDACEEVKTNLENGKAYEKFVEFVNYQGGNIDNIAISDKVFSIKSPHTGFVRSIDNYKIGEIMKKIGAGRLKKEDNIDYGVGIILNKKVGDYVIKDEELLKVYLNHTDLNINEIVECFEIAESVGELNPIIYEVIR